MVDSTSRPAVQQMTDHPWVAVDLDGTLMEDHTFPGYGQPRPGAQKAMLRLKELGLKIMVFTARTHVTGLDGRFQNVNKIVDGIREWAKEHEIPIDYVWPMPKPASILCFFDDRAIAVPQIPHESVGVAWADAMQDFEARYAAKIPNWLREVTPKSFHVETKPIWICGSCRKEQSGDGECSCFAGAGEGLI